VPRARPVLAVLAALIAALFAAGCVSVPTGGPVGSYPVTQGTGAQNQQYVQIVPQPPRAGWSPTQIVQGFLTASASFGNNSHVALEYLTPQEQNAWKPSWSAIVYKSGPDVTGGAAPTPGVKGSVTVQITGREQAYLKGYGSYSVPLASSVADDSQGAQQNFQLVKMKDGQWRISSAPQKLLLTSDSFNNDYQLRDLYFLDPTQRFLVPDPVYVPLRASPEDLMNGLVSDLITPPGDWLSSGATKTALPRGTKISDVTLSGVTAVVNLTGTAISKASNSTMELVSSQLLLTLRTKQSSTAQPVQSVEVEVNGKPWSPPGSQGNPVQTQATVNPAATSSGVFYYVDSEGYLDSRNGLKGKPVRGAHIGTGFSQIAVSPDATYVAALRGGTLYTGSVSGPLTGQSGTGFVAVSWDASDDLWASQGNQLVMFRGTGSAKRPLSPPEAVEVNRPGVINNLTVPFGQLKVAPDGVRVALVIDGSSNVLTFGAISGQQGATPRITLSQVQLSPQSATTFTSLTWYDPDDVITLADPGPVMTEFAVSGGTATPITVEPDMQSVAASAGHLLIAGLPKGTMWANPTLTGAWTLLGSGSSPVYPG
jgi:spore germination protein GerM